MLSPGKLLRETELEDTLHQNIELLDPNWLTIGRQVGTANGKYLDLPLLSISFLRLRSP